MAQFPHSVSSGELIFHISTYVTNILILKGTDTAGGETDTEARAGQKERCSETVSLVCLRAVCVINVSLVSD